MRHKGLIRTHDDPPSRIQVGGCLSLVGLFFSRNFNASAAFTMPFTKTSNVIVAALLTALPVLGQNTGFYYEPTSAGGSGIDHNVSFAHSDTNKD